MRIIQKEVALIKKSQPSYRFCLDAGSAFESMKSLWTAIVALGIAGRHRQLTGLVK